MVDAATYERIMAERNIIEEAMRGEGFQLLMKKLDQAADAMPQEMMNLMLQGKIDEATEIKYAYRCIKVILPKKIELIVNIDKKDSLFTFREWLKDLFKRSP
jgi:hypothetical protein